ncbi:MULTISPECIES: MFS transporter [unclassified Variovorax]|uniref:MFS transporter n=1 Tax=unclassified Variovorax TaxID=663243 RepID=UPI0015FF447A|nr:MULTISPECIES: MFS transporter [unclassified Variovorax]MBB1600077.1 MFS transporter [Variovorax sp. UMC13]MDM0090396.1 MFS transporter [Variovorax sp. J22G40]MDM0147939.1 MFS transporter [Variovorax sp. J2P1-31]
MGATSRGNRWATRTQFFCSGFIFATWGVHVPTIKTHYGLDEAQLGFAMLAAGVGALFGITRASRWIGRHGARRIAGCAGTVYALLIALLVLMPGYAALLGLLAAFGLVTSVFDVAINTDAAQLEAHEGAHLMSGMHGMFSLGGMVGAVSGGAALATGMGVQAHLLAVAAVMALAIAGSSTRMLPRPAGVAADADAGFRLPRGALVVMGVLAALGLIAEGAIYDWSVLYLNQELGAPQQQAALAYASFSAAMAAARFGGDALRARFAPAQLLRASALLAAASMTLVLLTDLPWLALAGFAGVGVGFANVVPILFAASAQVPGVEPSRGIAAVSAAAYLGFMAGPPVIGLLARVSSLTIALYTVVAFAVALAASARYANTR